MTTQLISAGRARGATSFGYGVPQSGAATTPVSEGGIVELSTATTLRPSLTAADIAAFMPATRSQFTFPAPYNTKAWRITLPSDTTNDGDGVEYNGYSFWNKMSHNGDALYILVGLNGIYGRAANTGANYYILTKSTGVVTGPFPIFAFGVGSDYQVLATNMYFSPTLPTKLYYTNPNTTTLKRVDILTGVKTTVCDLDSVKGVAAIGVAGCTPDQAHTSYDENVHAFRCVAPVSYATPYAKLGVAVYTSDTDTWKFYAHPAGELLDERPVLDCTGSYVWAVSYYGFSPAAGWTDPYYRVIRLSDDRITQSTIDNGHVCPGYNGLVGVFSPANTAYPSYNLYHPNTSPFSGNGVREVYRDNSYHDNPSFPASITSSTGHVSWINATNTDPSTQYCGGSGPGIGRGVVDSPRANELYCFKLDGSLTTLVFAPTMCSRDSTGGDQGTLNYDYAKMAKASICMQGRYMCWTTNLCSDRLDMFVVQVPRNVVGWDL